MRRISILWMAVSILGLNLLFLSCKNASSKESGSKSIQFYNPLNGISIDVDSLYDNNLGSYYGTYFSSNGVTLNDDVRIDIIFSTEENNGEYLCVGKKFDEIKVKYKLLAVNYLTSKISLQPKRIEYEHEGEIGVFLLHKYGILNCSIAKRDSNSLDQLRKLEKSLTIQQREVRKSDKIEILNAALNLNVSFESNFELIEIYSSKGNNFIKFRSTSSENYELFYTTLSNFLGAGGDGFYFRYSDLKNYYKRSIRGKGNSSNLGIVSKQLNIKNKNHLFYNQQSQPPVTCYYSNDINIYLVGPTRKKIILSKVQKVHSSILSQFKIGTLY